MPVEPPLNARVTLPPWLWGGNPQGLLAESDYQSRPDGASFLLRTDESYFRRKPDLVRLRPIVTTGNPPRWESLARLVERVDIGPSEMVASALERRREQAESSGHLLDMINHQQLLLYALSVDDLPVQSQYFLDALTSVRFTEDPDDGPFSNAGLHVIEINPVLVHRLKIPSVWLRVEQDAASGPATLPTSNAWQLAVWRSSPPPACTAE